MNGTTKQAEWASSIRLELEAKTGKKILCQESDVVISLGKNGTDLMQAEKTVELINGFVCAQENNLIEKVVFTDAEYDKMEEDVSKKIITAAVYIQIVQGDSYKKVIADRKRYSK